MRARFALACLATAALASPALADKRLDPDPAFLVKARTAATAQVEPHYDLMSEKVPFWARFLICAGQLTAARDEGRALPVPKDEIEKLIADYRARAADLIAYRQKADATAKPLDVDAEIAKVRSGAMQFLPADTTKFGVEHMKKLHGNRVTFCQLTRDWYEVQNGQKTATPLVLQEKLAKEHEAAMRRIAAESFKPPQPPILFPVRTAMPTTTTTGQPPIPTAKVIVPPVGTPVGGDNARDHRVGSEVAHADARTEFAGRALWSAVADCSARMALIQARTGENTKLQQDGYARRAAYIMAGNRSSTSESNLATAANQVSQERTRLAPRVAALWDEYRQRTGTIPYDHWRFLCGGLETYAFNQGQKIQEENQRIHAEKLKQYHADLARQRVQYQQSYQPPAGGGSYSGGGSSYSGGSYGSSSSNSINAWAASSRAEHRATMQQYDRNIQQIRQEIRAIDRKYGR